MSRGHKATPGIEGNPNFENLKEITSMLAKSGGTTVFFTVRRRVPGGTGQTGLLYKIWKDNVPADEVDNLRDFCYSGGEEYEYKIWVKDGNGLPVKGLDGKGLGPYYIPAAREPDPAQVGTGAQVPIDPILADRQQALKERRAALALERQEALVDAEARRLERMRDGEDEDEDEDELVYDPRFMPPPYGMGYPGYTPPWMQQPPPKDTFADTLKVFIPVIVAWITRPQAVAPNPMGDPLVLKLLMGEKMGPKDFIGMFAPMVAEMGKASSEANRLAMQTMAEMDKEVKLRILDAIMADPNKEQSEVDKWKKWLGLGKDVLREGVGVVKAAFSGAKDPDGKGDTKKDPARLETRKAPGLPAPKPKASDAPSKPADEAPPEEPKKPDPKTAALELKRERVKAFLTACEEEAFAESDPQAVAERLDELYSFLPKSLREKIEAAMDTERPTMEGVTAVLEALKEYCPDVVERVVADVMQDTTGRLKEFYMDLMDAVTHPEVDEEPPVPPDVEPPEKPQEDTGPVEE